jgi:hypothetical protein
MSLDKTAERIKKIREKNRLLRASGLINLSAPGPWYPIAPAVLFDPSFFKGLIEQDTAIDIPSAK